MVRAKFYVESKTEVAPGGKFQIGLRPVVSGSEENKSFFHFTPGGEIKLTTINAEAADQLQVGREYFVDFTEAPKPAN